MSPLSQPRPPRFSAAWGAGLSLGGYFAADLAGADVLRIVFGLLAGVFALYLVAKKLAAQRSPRGPLTGFPRTGLDFFTLLVLAAYLAAALLGASGWRLLLGILLGFLAVYYVAGWLRDLRTRLLWRLRNRLLVTFFFIAVIPIFLILGMVGMSAYLLYGQLAGYLIASDLESEALQLGAVNQGLIAELASHALTMPDTAELPALLQHEYASLRDDYEGLTLVLVSRRPFAVPAEGEAPDCGPVPGWAGENFRGVIASDNQLFLHTVGRVPGGNQASLCLTVPLNEALLTEVGREIGRFNLDLLAEVRQRPSAGGYEIGERNYVLGARIGPVGNTLPPARHFLDPVLSGVSKFNVVDWETTATERRELPVLIYLTTRPSLLNQRLFAPLGEVAGALVAALVLIGLLFLILEVLSLITGVGLTRSITTAVHDLYGATQRLQRGDFSVRIPHRRNDQLGALGDSFNQMAGSLERLIEESKERERLQSELEIARQVQEQLFPGPAPQLETLELFARCRPARVVSGDYYDYGLAEPGKLLFTIGDISGKGISAALLMATTQSILRSHGYASRLLGPAAQLSPAELVRRVNRQLCATTSPEKYSTLFIGLYDDRSRQLTYTNAGHMPPVLIRQGGMEQLLVGGTVVGLFGHLQYEQTTVQLQPGDWLIAFTDGLTEVENSYEEEYGSERLLAFLQRTADSTSPARLIDAVMAELQQWAPGVEPNDDRTMLVGRAR